MGVTATLDVVLVLLLIFYEGRVRGEGVPQDSCSVNPDCKSCLSSDRCQWCALKFAGVIFTFGVCLERGSIDCETVHFGRSETLSQMDPTLVETRTILEADNENCTDSTTSVKELESESCDKCIASEPTANPAQYGWCELRIGYRDKLIMVTGGLCFTSWRHLYCDEALVHGQRPDSDVRVTLTLKPPCPSNARTSPPFVVPYLISMLFLAATVV